MARVLVDLIAAVASASHGWYDSPVKANPTDIVTPCDVSNEIATKAISFVRIGLHTHRVIKASAINIQRPLVLSATTVPGRLSKLLY